MMGLLLLWNTEGNVLSPAPIAHKAPLVCGHMFSPEVHCFCSHIFCALKSCRPTYNSNPSCLFDFLELNKCRLCILLAALCANEANEILFYVYESLLTKSKHFQTDACCSPGVSYISTAAASQLGATVQDLYLCYTLIQLWDITPSYRPNCVRWFSDISLQF